MKKALVCLAFLAGMLVLLSVTAYAQGYTDSVTSEEQDALTQLMDIRGIGGDVSMEVLYDHDDNPEFIMGTTTAGYLIMDRNSYACMEWGTGKSPYNGYQDNKKYYGGILCYFVDSENGYLNILTNEKETEIA